MLLFQVSSQLADLREISNPEPISYMPQTIGWYILLGLLAVGIWWWAFRRYRLWRENWYRREALHELLNLRTKLQRTGEYPEVFNAVMVLMKRTALHRFPRKEVAKLSGEQWVHFLQNSHPGNGFHGKLGTLITSVAYSSPAIIDARCSDEDMHDLMCAAEDWIRMHRVPKRTRDTPRV